MPMVREFLESEAKGKEKKEEEEYVYDLYYLDDTANKKELEHDYDL